MRRISTGFFVLLALTGATAAFAAPTADQAKAIRQQLAAKKAEHAETTKKAKAIGGEVSTLKQKIMKLSGDLRESENNLSATEDRLGDLRRKKAACLDVLYKDRQAMGGLIAGARKYQQTSTVDLIARSNPIDAARAAAVMKSMMPEINEQSTALQSKVDELNGIEADITAQLQLQADQNRKLGKQQGSLAQLLKERSKMYEATESQRVAQEKEMAELTKQAKTLDDLMKSVKKRRDAEEPEGRTARAAPLPANILLPVRGSIVTGFGDKNDLGAPSKGITFETRPGSSVIVPLAGTVKFAGPFQNYKQILIVEHPGGYHSLIAGLAHIDTVVGAALSAGEPVGEAEDGKTPEIYYELRQNGKPVNPKNLLVAQRKQEKG